MEKTINVKGRAQIALKPDIALLHITLEDTVREYAKALQASAEKTEKLKDIFEGLGFKREELKTCYFDVNTAHEGQQDENGRWKNVMVGYHFCHRLVLRMALDYDRLGQIFNVLADSEDLGAEFSVSYDADRPEQYRETLLAAAIEDARKSAEMLAKAAGVTLGPIRNILYGQNENGMVNRVSADRVYAKAMALGAAPEMEAQDIIINDTVTVIWGIE